MEYPTVSLAEIAAGDLAWWDGDRRVATEHWRRAVSALGDSPPDQAAAAMARMRLLQVSGNFGAFWLERPMQQALAGCPETEPWCGIAAADAQLWLPAFTGADPASVPELLLGNPLQGPASARVALATQNAGFLAESGLDGMGEGIRAKGLVAPSSGTWVLGLGIGAAPGAGIGGSVHFEHPDLGWKQHHLRLTAGGDSRGGFSISSSLLLHTRPSWLVYGAGGRSVADFYVDGKPLVYVQGLGLGGAGIYLQVPSLVVGLGGQSRWDNLGSGWLGNHGPWLSLSWTPTKILRWSDRLEAGFGEYSYLLLNGDLRFLPPLAGGTFAIHTGISYVPTDTPFFRLPSAGGSELLRGQPTGRYREALLIPLQIEYRHRLIGPLEGAVFADGAWIDGPHWSVGGGLRLILPPEDLNIIRVDLGYGEGAFGVVVGWGQAF